MLTQTLRAQNRRFDMFQGVIVSSFPCRECHPYWSFLIVAHPRHAVRSGLRRHAPALRADTQSLYFLISGHRPIIAGQSLLKAVAIQRSPHKD